MHKERTRFSVGIDREERGMKRDYREKQVEGMVAIWNARRIPTFRKMPVTVRMTNDKVGKSLSLQAGNVMIEIPLEQVTEIITLTERSGE